MTYGYAIVLDKKKLFTGHDYDGIFYDVGYSAFLETIDRASIYTLEEDAKHVLSYVKDRTYETITGDAVDTSRLSIAEINIKTKKES